MINVKDFGAVGDGVTMDTAAIQRAIDAGGVVNFPPGTYLTGTLYLRSYGGLHLEMGAKILASPNSADYNADDFCVQNHPRPHEEASGAHLIVGVEVTHVVISGDGIIDGNRKIFQHEILQPSGKYAIDKWRPSQMIYFVESDHITVRDVELNNAPYWSLFFHGCEDVSARGLKIYTEWRTRNGDGIDIDCCRRVTVSDCIIDTGDDCITLRADLKQLKDQTRVCEDVVVSNCVLKTCCNAIRVGVGSGIIRRAEFGNIVIHDTRTAVCLVCKYGCGNYEGAEIREIKFHDFILDCKRPFFFQSASSGPVTPEEQRMSDIEVFNFSGNAVWGSLLQGNPGYPLKRLSFRNINVAYCGGDDVHEEEIYRAFRNCAPPEAFHLEWVADSCFEQVRIDWTKASENFKYTFLTKNCSSIALSDCQSDRPNKM